MVGEVCASTTQESLLPNLSLQLPRGVVDCRASVGWLTLIHVLHISCPPVCLHESKGGGGTRRWIDCKRRRDGRRRRGREQNEIRSTFYRRGCVPCVCRRPPLRVSLYCDVLCGTASLPLLTPLWPTVASAESAALSSQHVCTQQLWDSTADNQQQVALVPARIKGRKICSVYLSGPPGSSHLPAGQALHLFALWRVELIHTQWCVIMSFIFAKCSCWSGTESSFLFSQNRQTDFSACCLFSS